MNHKVLIYTIGAGLMISSASYAKKKDSRANDQSPVLLMAETDPPKPAAPPPAYNAATNRFSPPKLPASIAFAGEQTPLNRWDVKERLDRELLFNTYMHGSTLYI